MVQLQFINKLLDTKDNSLVTINNLDVSYFSEYKDEFNFIQDHYNKYGIIPDKTTFLAKFPNFDIIEVNEANSYLLAELQSDKNTRYLAETFNKIRLLLMEGKTDDAITLYNHANENLSQTSTLTCVDIIHDTTRFDEYVEKTRDFDKYYVKTGFKELDNIIGGWDRQEELATIIARTGTGKSWTLLKCAVAAMQQGLIVGIYSGEMSESKVGYRVDTLLSHISNGSLTHGNETIIQQYKNYIDELPTKYKGTIKVITPNMINGPAGVGALRAFIEKEKLDILFIDQHSLLEDDRKAKNPVERASNISKDLKNLQVMKKIPIISVSQMNRNKNDESEAIDSAQIAQSDRIGQDSTLILGIYRDKKDENVLKFQVVKSRDSVNNSVFSYYVDLNSGTFKYIEEDNEDNDLESRYAVSADNSTENVF